MKKTILLIAMLLSACDSGSDETSAASNTTTTSQPPQPNIINGISVPPAPDAVANATLLGVDSNNNGVRDDVDRQIAMMYGANAELYEGALRIAKSDQGLLIANGDPVKSTAATIAAATSGFCIADSISKCNN